MRARSRVIPIGFVTWVLSSSTGVMVFLLIQGPTGVIFGLIGAVGLAWFAYDAQQRDRDAAARALAARLGVPNAEACSDNALRGSLTAIFDASRNEAERDIARIRLLGAVVDAIPAPLVAFDARAGTMLSNRATSELLGGSVPPVGAPMDEVFTQRALQDMVRRAFEGESDEQQMPLAFAGRSAMYQVFTRATTFGGGVPGAVVVLRDVSELARASQLKTDFVANASHELRTPIAALRAACETMTGVAQDDPEMLARIATMMADHVGRLEDLVSDLLDLSRVESPEFTQRVSTIDLDEFFESLIALFEPRCQERGLMMSFQRTPGLDSFESDRGILQLIVRNLVDNAIKYGKPGTGVDIAVKGEDGTLRISVRDRGIGIPLKDQERIFERFYQVDPARTGSGKQRGTGLGLAIVKHAVRQLGGEIAVKSVWQQGTTMTVTLPRTRAGAVGDAGDGGALESA